MKICLVILLIAVVQVSVGQDSTAIQKLQTQFREIYYNNNEPDANFFNRLYKASIVVFNLENDVFFEELTARKKKNKVISNDSLAGEIFDLVVSWHTKNHLWDNNPGVLAKYKTIFTMYNEKFCPCATKKLISKNFRIEQSDMNNCVAMLIGDTVYLNTVRREMGSSTVTDLMNISQLAGVYLFEKCPALYQYFVSIPRDEVIASANVRIQWFFHDAEKKVVEMYNAKSFARLASYFPDYKNFNHEIMQIKDLLNEKDLITSFDKRSIAPGKTEVTRTYYSNKNKKPLIHSQVIYVFTEENVDASLVSLRLIPAEKIKNLKAVLKKIEEDETLVPPEVIFLEDTKIDLKPTDTLQKKKKQ